MYTAKLHCIRFLWLGNHWRSRVGLNQSWICTVILVLAQVAVPFGDEIVPIGRS